MRALLILALALAVTACGTPTYQAADGTSVSQRHGRLFMGDVPLDHRREVVLEGELDLGLSVFLATAGGPIEVSGAPGSGFRLVVELYSEFEDDGDVRLDSGRLTARPGRGRTLVHSVRGLVPEGASLELASGTGDMVVRTLVGENHLTVDSGTGSLRVADCEIVGVHVDSGTGDVNLEGCALALAEAATGTADLVAVESRIGRLAVSSGTGDVRLRRGQIEDLEVSSGTGDLLLIDTSVASLETNLATGEVVDKSSED